jgi:MoxR-like ATPase
LRSHPEINLERSSAFLGSAVIFIATFSQQQQQQPSQQGDIMSLAESQPPRLVVTQPKPSALDKILKLESELNSKYFEREGPIRSLVIGLIAQEHVLLLGPPGTAKSDLSRDLSKQIGADFFEYLMTKFSTPEEVFGPISLKQLQNDVYKRVVDRKLPSAQIAFLDEIFKANSAILNSLLTIINEREFDTGDGRIKVPLDIVIGASNEFPQDPGLAAVYDRFLLRHWVEDISADANFEALLLGQQASLTQTLSSSDLDELRALRKTIDITAVIPKLTLVRKDLKAKGIRVSDRTWKKCLKLIAAEALLNGRTAAISKDAMILKNSLWSDKDDRQSILTILSGECQDVNTKSAHKYRDMASECYNDLKKKVSEGTITQMISKSETSEGLSSIKDATLFWRAKRDELEKFSFKLLDLEYTPEVIEVADQINLQMKWCGDQITNTTKSKAIR